MDDIVANYKNSEKLSKLKTKDKLTFIPIPNGSHHNLVTAELYLKTLDSIL